MSSIFTRKQRHFRSEPIADEIQATIENQEEEITALRHQLSSLKSLFQANKNGLSVSQPTKNEFSRNELPGEVLYQKQRIEKLMSVVAEREKQMRELHNEIQAIEAAHQQALHIEKREKQTALAEVEALHSQLTALKARFLEGQRLQKAQQIEIESLSAEKAQASLKLEEAVRIAEHKDYLERECERMTQTQIDLTLRLEEMTTRVSNLEEVLKSKESIILEKDGRMSVLGSTIEELERKMVALQNERNLLQDNAFRTQSAQEDAEARLKVAHFHLAKKVKETAQLNDANENLEIQIRGLTSDVQDSQEKIQDLQKLLEEQFHTEKKRQEQLQESLKEATSLASAWEEKYFKIAEKWQEYELRFNEMKKVEEKLQKLHAQWINMGFLFDGLEQASVAVRPVPLAIEVKKPDADSATKMGAFPLENQVCDIKPNLFDIPQIPKIFKT